jgi:hypothetical protein
MLGGDKKKQKIPHPPPLNLKEKKAKAHPQLHVEPSHSLHKLSFSKIVCHRFEPRLIAPLTTWGTYWLVCT